MCDNLNCSGYLRPNLQILPISIIFLYVVFSKIWICLLVSISTLPNHTDYFYQFILSILNFYVDQVIKLNLVKVNSIYVFYFCNTSSWLQRRVSIWPVIKKQGLKLLSHRKDLRRIGWGSKSAAEEIREKPPKIVSYWIQHLFWMHPCSKSIEKLCPRYYEWRSTFSTLFIFLVSPGRFFKILEKCLVQILKN